MTCICVDSYTAVVHLIHEDQGQQMEGDCVGVGLVCVLVWGLGIATGIGFAVNVELKCSPIIEVPLALTVPATIVLDVAILRTLRKPDPSRKSSVHPQKQRALQTITNSLVMTLMSYLPSLVI